MQDDEAHALQNALLDAVHEGVLDLVVGAVAPPEQDVGAAKQIVREPLLGHVERNRLDLQVVGGEVLLQRTVNAARIETPDEVSEIPFGALVLELVPDGDVNLCHGFNRLRFPCVPPF